jgi:peptidoglycan/xylan/chitin deacetylase (PgdA/CDA1 family)
MPAFRHAAFAAAFQVINWTGAGRLARRWTQGAGAILMLHHVRPPSKAAFAPNQILEVTPDYLDLVLGRVRALGFDIIPIGEVMARLKAPTSRAFVALTFDDGYIDTVDHALPVLRKHTAPFTVYAAPGFAEATAPLWWIDLEDVVARSDTVVAQLDGGEHHFVTVSLAQKTAAFETIYWTLRKGPEPVLRAEIDRLARKAGIDPLARTRHLCLDWSGLKRLANEPLCTIGAHTLTHPMLAKHPREVAMAEIMDSKQQLEKQLHRDIRHFAYPVGDPGSAAEREFDLAREAGFETAVTTRPGMLFTDHQAQAWRLPRLSVNGLHQNRAAIDALLTGLPFALLNRGRKVV